jgi:hypothetical protein
MAAGTEKAYFGSLEFGVEDEPSEALLKKFPGVVVIGEPGPGKADSPQDAALPAQGIFPKFFKDLRDQAGRVVFGIEKIQIYRNKKIPIPRPGEGEFVQVDAGGIPHAP